MKKKLLLLVGLILSVFTLSSQVYYFTDSLFIEELGTFLQPTYQIHPENEESYIEFQGNWESGNLDDYKFGIIYVANSMKGSHSKAYPDFYNYITTLNALFLKNDMDYYTEWEVGLLGVVQTTNTKDIREYLEFSKLLVIDSILLQTSAVTWKANSTDYVIGNDPNTQKLYINFNNEIDLMCCNTSGNVIDTFVIERTTGTCFPVDQKWQGVQGRVTWKQAGLDGTKVFAKFGEYELDMRQSRFLIENAQFTNNDLNLFQIPGKLEVKLEQTTKRNRRPVFESDEKLIIKGIFPEVDFYGYFKMEGPKFIGSGKKDKATVFIRDKNESVVTLRSKEFEIEPGVSINSASTKTSFYFNGRNDSIWQDNLNVKYVSSLDSLLYKPDWFKFNTIGGNYLILSRVSGGMSMSPFQDTYHELNIYADKIVWAKGDTLLYVVTTRNSELEYVMFESTNYFNEKDYAYFSGNNSDHLNHLAEIKNFYEELSKPNNYEQLSPESYQKYLETEYQRQINITTIQTLFNQLSYAGFIFYDRELNYAVPNDKLYRYISNAGRQKLKKKNVLVNKDSIYPLQDYDKLMIISQKGETDIKLTNIGVNATINLVNNQLKITDVQPFRLSPNVKVYAEEIIVKENRNLVFGGDVGAGLMKLTGSKFDFDYEDYQISIQDEKTKMQMWTADTVGNDIKYTPVTTQISDVRGTLFINESDNKSNTIESEIYPELKTEQKAKIYYEEFASKYWTDSDSTGTKSFNEMFYFEADNFDLDSLNYLSDSIVQFKGKMNTGLFEPLTVTLTLKTNPKDGSKSLGFTECTDNNEDITNGLEFKGGKFFGCFTLNDKGLFGDGFILYASSYVHSDEFAFMPNEVIASVDTFALNPAAPLKVGSKEDIPYVVGGKVFFNWKDEMQFSKDKQYSKSKMILYSDKLETPGNLNGTLFYSDNKVSGSGIFEFDDANIIDTNFVFKNSSFSADACDFDLKVGNSSAFKTRNLNGNVDINEKLGSFYSNDDTSRIVFPENFYVCIMDHFLWKIGEGIVNIGGVMPGKDTNDYVTSLEEKIEAKKNNKDIKLYGTILVGTADTLTFNASSTTYLLEDKTIIAENVDKIKIADAIVYPKGTVTVKKGGKIDTLKNISFEYPYKLFSDEKKEDYLHYFENADVIIVNRFNYKARKPLYHYKYMQQPIVFESVIVRDAPGYLPSKIQKNFKDFEIKSIATKNMKFGDTLDLNSDFVYEGQGKIKIYAEYQNPEFEGFARMDSTCNDKKVPINVFKLAPTILDPDSISMVMLSEIQGRNKTLNSGLYWETTRVNSKSTYGIRRSFLDNIDPGSEPIFTPSGVIYYNPKTGEYRIGPAEKVVVNNPDSLWGDMMSYSKNLCIIKAQGQFDIFQNWDVQDKKEVEHINSLFRGYYRSDVEEDNNKFQGAWSLDFLAPDIIMNDLADKAILGTSNRSILEERDRMEKNYFAYLGKPNTDKIFSDIDNFFDYDQPKELKHTIMFSDINLLWSPDSSSLVSVGQLGVASINGKKIDRYIDGYVKYQNTKKVRMLIIIFEPIPGVLYAFKYRYADGRGIMKVYAKTGNLEIDNYFDGLKDNDKSFKDDYYWSKTSEDEFKAFAKEYIKNK
ncbi:MAG: hypothetical protein JXL97_10590 [Bacteroidales bacterium]|nr:hypothetical protein [Bacteroidales bacterium]